MSSVRPQRRLSTERDKISKESRKLWVEDQARAYKISEETMKAYLHMIFPNVQIDLRLVHDSWTFYIPRKLTGAERSHLEKFREASFIENSYPQNNLEESQTSSIEDSYPRYNLKESKLRRFLRNLFPGLKIDIMTTKDDKYTFLLPRLLTQHERDKIAVIRDRGHQSQLPMKASLNTAELLTTLPTVKQTKKETRARFRLGPVNESGIESILTIKVPGAEFEDSMPVGYLYSSHISTGSTCKVFGVDARRSWVSMHESTRYQSVMKVAIKRLTPNVTMDSFLQEYNALKLVKNNSHRNIVEMLNTFRYLGEDGSVFYNFSFPLAAGNLEQLFLEGRNLDINNPNNNNSQNVRYRALVESAKSLWSEFEGLASALVHLHNKCGVVHNDIKPSNILLYYTNRQLVAKLADFGLATVPQNQVYWKRSTKEFQYAWHHQPPDLRDFVDQRESSRISSQESLKSLFPGVMRSEVKLPEIKLPEVMLKGGDIWKLGAVFTELLTFLVDGSDGVPRFRNFIAVTKNKFASNELNDLRFDDGQEVKTEVLEWLSNMSKKHYRAREITGLLQRMLSDSKGRPSADEVLQFLQNSSYCTWFDGVHFVQIRHSTITRPNTLFDTSKEMIENMFKNKFDWWPFPNSPRACRPGYSRISWMWGGSDTVIDIPSQLADEYRKFCKPLSEATQSLSSYQNPQSGSATYTEIPPVLNRSNDSARGKQNVRRQEKPLPPVPQDISARDLLNPVLKREIHWCVDRALSEPRETMLCLLRSSNRDLDTIFDDRSLCEQLTKHYSRIRTWKGKYLSWKSCLGVDFIQYDRPDRSGDDILPIKVGLPPSNTSTNNYSSNSSRDSNAKPVYEYTLVVPEEVHMKRAAAMIIKGMHKPPEVGKSVLLRMIPQKLVDPQTNHPVQEEWGMHARQHISLVKFLYCVAFLTALGLGFVIFWLIVVNKTDLQNASIPFIVLSSGILIALGVPQIMGFD